MVGNCGKYRQILTITWTAHIIESLRENRKPNETYLQSETVDIYVIYRKAGGLKTQRKY